MTQSADIAVVTNLAPNHLDVHKDMAEYIAAKENVYLHQGKTGKLVVNMDNEITNSFAEKAPGTVEKFSRLGKPSNGVWLENGIIYRNGRRIMPADDIKIPGVHNIENYMAAACATEGLATDADVDAVAVTFAPGLIGAVLVGVNFAKGLAYGAGKPLVPVHHLRGHIAANYLTHPQLEPPFLCLVASGGHSHIVQVEDWCKYHVLGRTVDDAAGEAFDKVARTLGLPYPGGPSVSQAAKTGDPHYYKLPTPHVEGKYNVSFSGLKTAVVNEVHNAQQRGEEVRVADMAASFQERIAQILAKKLLAAAADTNAKTICLAGGVAANGRLRQLVNDGAQKLGAKVYLPELKYCGDNGAMIAAQGYYEFKDGNIADLTLNGLPTLAIDYR